MEATTEKLLDNITDVERIRLKPSDVLVIKVPAGTRQSVVDRIGHWARDAFPDLGKDRIIVSQGDIEFSVIDQEQASGEPS